MRQYLHELPYQISIFEAIDYQSFQLKVLPSRSKVSMKLKKEAATHNKLSSIGKYSRETKKEIQPKMENCKL
jgi:hypothetical protein